MLQFAKEGYPFIIFFASITVISAILGLRWGAALALILTLFMFYFFRDPERVITTDRNAFIAPADGKIILITEAKEDEILNGNRLKISTFMSPLNVHINRAPCDGIVKDVQHYPGKFYSAFKDDASILNEHITMLLDCDNHGPVVVKQIAGAVARRAVCRVKPGESLSQGERYGMIKFSSRVDIYLPLDTEIKVQLNDRVTAGETILGVKELKS
ncbi:MAG TPA: phosphatidylserine decarboxylase family protein [Nitrospirae bacterium]|nr:phosphatidylserine decarboxylase proenzyme [bacterium BMS3Abin06]HDH12709.1 phosphatidylserine decarboxylase family protein [Nitrospirota bacterium]HDZ00018.1 phosphatidylserine decarboxylase family protein [Nitrospirota bacterium]